MTLSIILLTNSKELAFVEQAFQGFESLQDPRSHFSPLILKLGVVGLLGEASLVYPIQPTNLSP